MPQTDDFPLVSEALLKALDRIYPEKMPEVSALDRDIWVAVGRRQVVRFLQQKHQQQFEKANDKLHVQHVRP